MQEPTEPNAMPQEPRITRMKLRDALAQGIIKRDPKNANLSTERGRYMIETSMEKTGLGRGIVLDKDGYIPAGNQTVEIAAELFEDAEVIIVETDGKQLVATRRVDFDLMDDRGVARQYAVSDNRSSEVSLNWSANELQALLDSGVSLDDWFFDDELDILLSDASVIGNEVSDESGSGSNMSILGDKPNGWTVINWGDIMVTIPRTLYDAVLEFVSDASHLSRQDAMIGLLETGLESLRNA